MEHWRMVKRVCSLLSLGGSDEPTVDTPRFGTLPHRPEESATSHQQSSYFRRGRNSVTHSESTAACDTGFYSPLDAINELEPVLNNASSVSNSLASSTSSHHVACKAVTRTWSHKLLLSVLFSFTLLFLFFFFFLCSAIRFTLRSLFSPSSSLSMSLRSSNTFLFSSVLFSSVQFSLLCFGKANLTCLVLSCCDKFHFQLQFKLQMFIHK